MAAPTPPSAQPHHERESPVRLRRLLPPGGPVTVEEALGASAPLWTLRAAGRPYVALNMISTADGRASLGGRSGPLGNRADRELFHGLRASVDAVMAGGGTVRAERYGRLVREESARELRRRRGLRPEPLACIVSGRLALTGDIPLLADASSRVVILTSSAASLPGSGAKVEYVRGRHDGELDLAAALAELGERFSVGTLLCEGGPHLNAQLLAAGLVDELFLSLAPKLAGGDPPSGESLRILAGPPLPAPLDLELLEALESESLLLLRYRVGAGAAERVSRETTLSSSPAR
jgi:riboflavin biosynthesis pyrimidine reductase